MVTPVAAICQVLILKESAIQNATKFQNPQVRRACSTGCKSKFCRKSSDDERPSSCFVSSRLASLESLECMMVDDGSDVAVHIEKGEEKKEKKRRRRRKRRRKKEERKGEKTRYIYEFTSRKKKKFHKSKSLWKKKKMVVNYTRLKQMQGFFFFFFSPPRADADSIQPN